MENFVSLQEANHLQGEKNDLIFFPSIFVAYMAPFPPQWPPDNLA